MTKRKNFIELQSKPENKAVRQLFKKTKPVDYAPLAPKKIDAKTSRGINQDQKNANEGLSPVGGEVETDKMTAVETRSDSRIEEMPNGEALKRQKTGGDKKRTEDKPENTRSKSSPSKPETPARAARLRIFQTSTPVTRTVTKFQKAAIVVRGENGKQLVELFWRDQMNEKTRDIWNFLVVKFEEAGQLDLSEISIRKREILDRSGVRSDRTFINAIYTLEDMGLIQVKRLSGNKEGNIYILTGEGKEEIESYHD